MENIILAVYGIFLIAGGYFGYKKGSKVSLIMGAVSGFLVFVSLWLMTVNLKGGWIFLSCVTGLLATVFLIRFIKTQMFMPAGMLFILTLSVLIFSLNHLR